MANVLLFLIRISLGLLVLIGFAFVFLPNKLNQLVAETDIFNISRLLAWNKNGDEWGNVCSLIIVNFYIYIFLLFIFILATYFLTKKYKFIDTSRKDNIAWGTLKKIIFNNSLLLDKKCDYSLIKSEFKSVIYDGFIFGVATFLAYGPHKKIIRDDFFSTVFILIFVEYWTYLFFSLAAIILTRIFTLSINKV